MRFLELELTAFGPFTGRVLDLSAGDPGLHVIYGHNEAGKSTALRAISGLLYGIPERTRDAHVHRTEALRIGARLRMADGSELRLVRRKGRKNTLLGPDGGPLDEGALRRRLGGVGETLFSHMFGLDHASLREGANALLRGQGDVGESLFDASLGGRGVRDLLDALEREANELFRPRASTPLLNAALKAFEEAKKRRTQHSLRPAAWSEQKKALEAARSRREALVMSRRALRTEEQRLSRTQHARPLVAKRSALAEERRALGDGPLLPADSRGRRENAQRALADSERELERRQGEIDRLVARRGALEVPEELAALDEQRMEALRDRLAAERKAAVDLPKRRGELEALEAEVKAILKRLGRGELPGQAAGLVPDVALQARVRDLALKQQSLVDQLGAAREQQREIEQKLAAAGRRRGELPGAPDSDDLERAVAAARREGDLDARLAEVESGIEQTRRAAEQRHAALGLWSGPLRDLPALSLPLQTTVDDFDARFAAHAQRGVVLSERREELLRKLDACHESLDRLQRGGAVPTEAELDAARARRDGGWQLVRRAWKQAEDVSAEAKRFDAERPLDDAFERAQLDADQLADRLRREAARVEQLAYLGAEQTRLECDLERVGAERGELDTEQQALSAEWATAWCSSGIEPLGPGEMRGWLARHAELSAQVEQLAARQHERDALDQRRTAHIAALVSALGEGAGGLAPLLDRGEAELERRAALRRERQQLSSSIADLGAGLEQARRRVSTRETGIERWQSEWDASIESLGLAPGASPAEVTAVLAELVDLGTRAGNMDAARRRIASMERDATEFAAEVEELVRAHAPSLAERSTLEAAGELLKRYTQARRDLDARVGLDRDLDSRRRERDELGRKAERAGDELSALLIAAGVEQPAALEEAEQRSNRARELEQKLREVDDQLLDLREGEPLEALAQAVAMSDEADARGRLADIERELGELEEALRDVDQDIGARQRELDQLGGTAAADDAADAEQQIARIEELSDRYVRARLAARVLGGELERYREQHQGPIISRASELFPVLTLGRYRGLRVEVGAGSGDDAVLRCVRADDKRVDIEALSDGARDQLYLALRTASLERFSGHNEPLPVVFDDVLVQFDDDRARAALEVLGGLAARTQVLFFTHHQRLVALAREAVDAARLVCHELDDSGNAT